MRLLRLLLPLCAAIPLARGAVLITHFNTFPLLDSDGTTPLDGTSSSGDLIQVVDAGLNGVPDLPDAYGFPSGDDLFLAVLAGSALTHVADNEPGVNWHQGLYNDTLTVDDSLIGQNIFLRFWNGTTPDAATHYGESDPQVVPSAPLLGPAFLDFVPVAGSSRTANIAFTALAYTAVPEPSSMLALGFALLAMRTGRRLRQFSSQVHRTLPVVALSLAGAWMGMDPAQAQLPVPLDVMASRPILDSSGSALPGSSPDAPLFSFSAIPGALIQLLNAGANGVADLPAADGTPGGDDQVVTQFQVGRGIAPNVEQSGRFSTTIATPPASGSRLFARAFNAPERASATRWGQSSVVTYEPLKVIDVSELGLLATTLPLGVDLASHDEDADGVTDLEELRANTHAGDASDFFRLVGAGGQPSVRVPGRAGRRYALERTTGELIGAPAWERVATSAALTANADLQLQDPLPPAGAAVLYRVVVLDP